MANWNDLPHCTSVSGRLSSQGLDSISRSIRKCVSIGVFLVATTFLWVEVARSQAEVIDRILAIVNGHVIMKSDVQIHLTLQLVEIDPESDQESEVLTYLIERRLVLDQVDRVVAHPAPELVEDKFELVRSRFEEIEIFSDVLEQLGLTSDDLRQLLADDIRKDTYLTSRFASIPEELRAQAVSDWVKDLVQRGQLRLVSIRSQ